MKSAVAGILFLDDDRFRIATFSKYMASLGRDDVVAVETVAECLTELERVEWELVLLDHDLGGETYVDSERQDTGMEVVRWLRISGRPSGKFIVHSMNAAASAAMYFDLQELGHSVHQAPFGSPGFYRAVHDSLGLARPDIRPRRRSISERITAYIRSIRG